MIEKNISDVIKSSKLREKIASVGIKTLDELCSYSPKRLAEKGIESLYVKDITIALQCEGLDLKRK